MDPPRPLPSTDMLAGFHRSRVTSIAWLAALGFSVAACGASDSKRKARPRDSDEGGMGSSGAPGAGGARGAGGTPSTGGAPASGGAPGAGGASLPDASVDAGTGGVEAGPPDAAPDVAIMDAAEAGSTSVVRTIGFHQITSFTTSPTAPPVLSADGTRIVFPRAPGTQNPATPNEIFVVDWDGTGPRLVDSYTSGCFCGSKVAISSDGNVVASSDGVHVRAVSADGTFLGAIQLQSGEVWNLAVGDGTKIFFLVRRDTLVLPSTPLERGVWSMNPDGTGLTQLAGPAAVAALVGATAAAVFPFSVCGVSLSVSADGSRVAFGTYVDPLGGTLLGVNADGTGLHVVDGPITPPAGRTVSLYRLALSGDGSSVVYRTEMVVGTTELKLVGWDGTNRRILTDTNTTFLGGACDSPLLPTHDASQVLIAETGVLLSTGTGEPTTVSMRTGTLLTDPGWGLALGCCGISPLFSMAGSGRRFAYQNLEGAGLPIQIATAEINPPSLGAAPTLSGIRITEPSLPRDRTLGANVLSAVTSGGTVVRVGTGVLLGGLADTAGSFTDGMKVLLDDGAGADLVSGDGVYSGGAILAGSGSVVGPRHVRVMAEVESADSRRHATAVDVTGLEVR